MKENNEAKNEYNKQQLASFYINIMIRMINDVKYGRIYFWNMIIKTFDENNSRWFEKCFVQNILVREKKIYFAYLHVIYLLRHN